MAICVVQRWSCGQHAAKHETRVDVRHHEAWVVFVRLIERRAEQSGRVYVFMVAMVVVGTGGEERQRNYSDHLVGLALSLISGWSSRKKIGTWRSFGPGFRGAAWIYH